MVSLDNAVVARLEKGGKRYEILVDPELVEQFKSDSTSVSLDDLLATEKFGTMRGAVSALQKRRFSLLLIPLNY